MKDAAIYTQDGVLVIDFRQPIKKQSHHRNVTLHFDRNAVIVHGNQVSWRRVGNNAWSDSINIYKDVHLVKEEYIQEGRAYNFWGKTKKIVSVIKTGWVELKETNIPLRIRTTNYRIYE